MRGAVTGDINVYVPDSTLEAMVDTVSQSVREGVDEGTRTDADTE